MKTKNYSKLTLILSFLIFAFLLAPSSLDGGQGVAVAGNDYRLILPFIPKKLYTGPGTVIGRVVDATTADPAARARVCFGETHCANANASGEYVLSNVPYGLRTLTASADYYFSLDSPVVVKGGDVVVLNFAIFPNQLGGTRAMEIVLTWRPERTWPGQGCNWIGNPDPSGNCLNDLDTHMWLIPFEGSGLFPVHIDAGNRDKWGTLDSYPSARLRFDERWGSGPETLRVRAFEDVIYHYAVLNVNQIYSEDTVPPMRQTQARVYVRDGTGKLLLDLYVPTQGDGELWYVFTVDGKTGDLVVKNCLTRLPGSDLEPPTCP